MWQSKSTLLKPAQSTTVGLSPSKGWASCKRNHNVTLIVPTDTADEYGKQEGLLGRGMPWQRNQAWRHSTKTCPNIVRTSSEWI